MPRTATDLRVIIDLVHSHAVKNEAEGIARIDGTRCAYFHEGARGEHSAWDSLCFDYAKPEVLALPAVELPFLPG